MSRFLLSLAIVAMAMAPAVGRADCTLEYTAKSGGKAKAITQVVAIKEGVVMVKAAGGNKDLDLRYDRRTEQVTVIDHRKRTLTVVDEGQVDQLNQQAQTVQPLVQGLAEQVAKLSPDDRQKWQELLGGISLDRIAQAAQPPAATTVRTVGASRVVAGISCQPMRVSQGETAVGELCVATPAAVKIPDSDYATIRDLFALYERLASRSRRVARQFGLVLPTLSTRELAGIPIELRDLSRDEVGVATLLRIKTASVPAETMRLPTGYAQEPLAPW